MLKYHEDYARRLYEELVAVAGGPIYNGNGKQLDADDVLEAVSMVAAEDELADVIDAIQDSEAWDT